MPPSLRSRVRLVGPLALLLGACAPLASAVPVDGLDSGVIVHVAGASGDPVPWCADGRHLVLCLAPAERVAVLTAAVASAGRIAQIVVAPYAGGRLPVADHLARVVAIEGGGAELAGAEILRAAAPWARIAMAGGRDDPALAALPPGPAMGAWRTWVRTPPAGMGEWTHDQVANAGMTGIAEDDLDGKVTNIGSITRLIGDGYAGGSRVREPLRQPLWPRFITGNNRSRNGDNQASFVAVGGRLFAIQRLDAAGLFGAETMAKPQPVLVARDAASGLRLWSRLQIEAVIAGDEDALLVRAGDRIAALDPATGAERWSTAAGPRDRLRPPACFPVGGGEAIIGQGELRRLDRAGAARWKAAGPAYVVALAGHLVIVDGLRAAQGRDPAVPGPLRALSAADGTERWRLPAEERGPPLACADARWIVLDDGLTVVVLAAEDGRTVLTRTRTASSINGGRNGHLDPGNLARLVDGMLVMTGAEGAHSRPREQQRGPSAYRLPSGERIGDQPLEIDGIGYWCCNGHGIWTRGMIAGAIAGTAHPQADPAGSYAPGGTCATVGPVAYGTVYQPPLNCACLGFTYNLRGFLALAPPTPPPAAAWTERPQPIPGPGRGDHAPATGGWPMFRADMRRSASGGCIGSLAPAWTVRAKLAPQAAFQELDDRQRSAFNGPLTAPVAAGGLVVAGLPESRSLVAWSMVDGCERWRSVLGGAMDGPPTLTRGLALLGTHDGRVQALSLGDGKLAWTTRITPVDERMVAWGHLQDRFPAVGSVAMHGGLAWTTAGLCGEIGIMLAGLDPATGSLRDWRLLPHGAYLNDCLVADAAGISCWLGPFSLDPAQAEAAAASAAAAYAAAAARRGVGKVHLNAFLPTLRIGSVGFDAKSLPADRLIGIGEPLIAIGKTAAYDTGIRRMSKFDGMLWGQAYRDRRAIAWAFTDDVQVGVIQQLAPRGAGAFADLLLGDAVACFPVTIRGPAGDRPAKAGAALPPPRWTVPTDRIWALAIAGDRVLAAGPVRSDPDRDPRRVPGQLLVLALADGAMLQTLPLPAPPVQDGLAIADGMVAVTCWDGSVAAFSSTSTTGR